jgi:hypothetical protein
LVTWRQLAAAAPSIAERGRELLFRTGIGEGMLTTVAGGALPRTHPVHVGIVDGRLLTYLHNRSPKTRDLEADGRFALHAHQDPAAPHELLLRGRATRVTDATLTAEAAAGWSFAPGDEYQLFELSIEHAVLGERPSADDWPPRYTSWRRPSGSAP